MHAQGMKQNVAQFIKLTGYRYLKPKANPNETVFKHKSDYDRIKLSGTGLLMTRIKWPLEMNHKIVLARVTIEKNFVRGFKVKGRVLQFLSEVP